MVVMLSKYSRGKVGRESMNSVTVNHKTRDHLYKFSSITLPQKLCCVPSLRLNVTGIHLILLTGMYSLFLCKFYSCQSGKVSETSLK